MKHEIYLTRNQRSSRFFEKQNRRRRDPSLMIAIYCLSAVAVISTIIATTIGTLMAMALVRYQFRFRKALDLFVFLPLAIRGNVIAQF